MLRGKYFQLPLACPRALLEMQVLGLHPRPPDSASAFPAAIAAHANVHKALRWSPLRKAQPMHYLNGVVAWINRRWPHGKGSLETFHGPRSSSKHYNQHPLGRMSSTSFIHPRCTNGVSENVDTGDLTPFSEVGGREQQLRRCERMRLFLAPATGRPS